MAHRRGKSCHLPWQWERCHELWIAQVAQVWYRKPVLGLWAARAGCTGLPGSRGAHGAELKEPQSSGIGANAACSGHKGSWPQAQSQWQKQGRLLMWRKANTKQGPDGLPPPYHVIAQVVPLAYQRGQPPTNPYCDGFVGFFLIQVLHLLLSLHFILDGMYGFVQDTALQCCSTFSSSLPGTMYFDKFNFNWKKPHTPLTYLALCPERVDHGLTST